MHDLLLSVLLLSVLLLQATCPASGSSCAI
jgi:hypothetical protein